MGLGWQAPEKDRGMPKLAQYQKCKIGRKKKLPFIFYIFLHKIGLSLLPLLHPLSWSEHGTIMPSTQHSALDMNLTLPPSQSPAGLKEVSFSLRDALQHCWPSDRA